MSRKIITISRELAVVEDTLEKNWQKGLEFLSMTKILF